MALQPAANENILWQRAAHHLLKTHGSRGFHPDTQHTWKICFKSDNRLLKSWQIGQLSLQKQPLSSHQIFHALWQLSADLMSFKPDYHGTSKPTSTNYCLRSSDKVRPLIWRSVRQIRAASTECNGIKVVFGCCFKIFLVLTWVTFKSQRSIRCHSDTCMA